jgi:hypothetical protein
LQASLEVASGTRRHGAEPDGPADDLEMGVDDSYLKLDTHQFAGLPNIPDGTRMSVKAERHAYPRRITASHNRVAS